MEEIKLSELTANAGLADAPGITPAGAFRTGGVDPLGLRQINFNLMDEVLPGLNNVARHIRPFVLIAWAWRRAGQLALARGGGKIARSELQDFVDRIEVIYVWSQLLRDPDADLPGRQILVPLLRTSEFVFGGSAWEQRKKVRRYSTALSAPISYGPGLKMLGWVARHPTYPDVLLPTTAAIPALDAFEAQLSGMVEHKAFNDFGRVLVTRDEAESWADSWALDENTPEEMQVMADLLFGADAPLHRQLAGELLFSAAFHTTSTDADKLRSAMAGHPSDFTPSTRLLQIRDAWRRVQIRQLFRLALEALFYWTQVQLQEYARSTESLVAAFLSDLPPPAGVTTARPWIESLSSTAEGPVELINRINQSLILSSARLSQDIVRGLALCLTDSSQGESQSERNERLPLSRARREADALANASITDFARHLLESWVLAQHTFWSVGRGLADARAGGKVLLRLRIVLDEGGWMLAPGATRASIPQPTPDRLQTAIALATECGLFAP